MGQKLKFDTIKTLTSVSFASDDKICDNLESAFNCLPALLKVLKYDP